MNVALFLYAAEILNNLFFVLLVVLLIGLVVGCVWGIVRLDCSYAAPPIPTWMFVVYVFLLVVLIAIPSKETMYLMAGAGAAEKVWDSSISQKTLQLIEQNLDEMLKKGAKQ